MSVFVEFYHIRGMKMLKSEIQLKAAELLRGADINKLPINVKKITKNQNITVSPYGRSRELLETLGLTEYSRRHRSFSVNCQNDYFIFVSDDLTVDSERKAVAHELGHIVLHNVYSADVPAAAPEGDFFFNCAGGGQSDGADGSAERICDESPAVSEMNEREADAFALALLAPLPMLASLGVQDEIEIKRLTKLSLADSKEVLRMLDEFKSTFDGMMSCMTPDAPRAERRPTFADRVRESGIITKLILTALFIAVFIFGGALTAQFWPRKAAQSDIYATFAPEPAPTAGTMPQAHTNAQGGTARVPSTDAFSAARQSTAERQTAPPQTAPTATEREPIVVNDDTICWWTDSGSVYHLFPDCRALKNSQNQLISGPLSEAREEKDRLCRFCESSLEN